MKAWHTVSALVVLVALLVASHITVRTNYAYVSTSTGSRKTYTEWEIPIKYRTNETYIQSPIEAFLLRRGIQYTDTWVSYSGTGRTIFGAVTYRSHGRPGPVLEIRPIFFTTIDTMTDEEKMQIFDCLARSDQKEIEDLVLKIYQKSVK